jgi:hypothetical protein
MGDSTPMHVLKTVSIEPWTVLLGGFRVVPGNID